MDILTVAGIAAVAFLVWKGEKWLRAMAREARYQKRLTVWEGKMTKAVGWEGCEKRRVLRKEWAEEVGREGWGDLDEPRDRWRAKW